MAKINTANLKSGEALYFIGANNFPYWEPVPDAYVMDKVFENVLEGEVHSWGYGVPEENKWRWKKQFAEDADQAEIKPSEAGSSAGSYAGLVEVDANGTEWIKVNFPFTFYNRDGSNHDTDTTIQAWVKADEVNIKKGLSEKLQELIGDKPDKSTLGTDDGDTGTKTPWAIIIGILLLLGSALFFWNKKKKKNLAILAQRRATSTNQQTPYYQSAKL